MNAEKYFFRESTNIKLSEAICQVLCWDCDNFNFYKNGKCNFSGLLNRLIPELSHYRDDLHERFLKHNGNDEKIVRLVEDNINNIYIKTFDLNDDNCVNVPFRISKKYKQEFEIIYEQKLRQYGLDFTNYVRTMLYEYAVKPHYQREMFFYYRQVKLLQKHISQRRKCYYVADASRIDFVPMAIEFDENFRNYIIGIGDDMKQSVFVLLSSIDNIRFLSEVVDIEDDIYERVTDDWKKFLEDDKS